MSTTAAKQAKLLPFLAVFVLFLFSSNGFAKDRSLSDANFTGPLITPNPNAMPAGMLDVEPYLIYVYSDARHDLRGHREKLPYSLSQWQTLLPLTYGITPRLTARAVLGAAHTSENGNHTCAMRTTDTTLYLQYLLQAPSSDGRRPAISISLGQNVRTGQYQRLRNPLNGQGNGLQQTTLSVLAQQVVWMPNGRPLRWRGQLFWSPKPPGVQLHGVSVYGTSDGFRGNYYAGAQFGFSLGAEYSLDAHWVMVFEVEADRHGRSWLTSATRLPDGSLSTTRRMENYSAVYSVAPAIEYNFNDRFGLIGGTQLSVAGHNARSFVSPMIALNMVF